MSRKVISVFLSVILITLLVGCGSTSAEETTKNVEEVANTAETTVNETVDNAEESLDEAVSELEAIGDVDVDKGIFDVELTIPADFAGEVTQEQLDESVKEKGYESAKLNSDGSITYVMTKAQHKELLDTISKSIDDSLQDMVGSSDFPNITAVTANEDYTSFTITTKNSEPDMAESFSVLALYMYGGMYAVFNGEKADNIHVDFVNDASGEVISSADSSKAGAN